MKPLAKFASLSATILTLLVVGAQAQQMNYQGRLTNSEGGPLQDGQHALTFNIYDTAGALKWGPFQCDGGSTDGHAALADLINGRFNVILGPKDISGDLLTTAFAPGTGEGPEPPVRFLGITVGGVEISPLQQILPAPTALEAHHATTANHATTATNATHATTADTAANFTSVVLKTDESGTGRVGVGIAAPNILGKLHVNSDSSTPGLVVAVNGTTRLRADPNGGLTVGTSSPPPPLGLRVLGETTLIGKATMGNATVSGKITESGKEVPSAEEDLRIVRGNIDTNGATLVGQGFSCTVDAAEIYKIVFSPPFTGTPTLTGNVMLPQDDNFVAIHTLTPSECTLILRDNGDSDTRNLAPFTFIAIGPR